MEHHWTIVAVADDGEHVSIEENSDKRLAQLLTKAVRELYGHDHVVDEYEILLQGVVQTNLDLTLEQAGLHDHAEVVVQRKDVSKG